MLKYPFIKQHDAKDCGAACLGMVSSFYGYKTPLSTIRYKIGTNKLGSSVLGIVNAAREIGFDANGFSTEDKKGGIFDDIPLPCIAHLIVEQNFAHFVVLYKITKTSVTIGDPAKAIKTIKIEEFLEMWTGTIMTIIPTVNLKKTNESRGLFTRFFGLLRYQKKLLIHIFFASLIITTLGILGSFYSQILFDDILPTFSEKSLHTFSLAIIILVLTRVVTEAFRNKLFIYVGANLNTPMMLGFFKHVIRMPYNFFGTMATGDILSRLQDTSIIRDAISATTLSALIDLIMVVFGGIILYRQNSTLFYITFIPIIVLVIILLLFKKTYYRMNREALSKNSEYNAYMVESISGVETIKSFSLENFVSFVAENKFVSLLQKMFFMESTENFKNSLQSVIDAIFANVVLWVGVYFIFNGKLSIGELMAFNALLTYYLTPIKNIIGLQSKIQKAIIASERVSDIIDLDIEQNYNENALEIDKLKGNIEFKNVTVRYRGRIPVFTDMNVTINEGESVAIIGESGCGKSTLAKLIMRFIEPQAGELIIGEHSIPDYDLMDYRDRITYLSQNSFLFSGTIFENLIMHNPSLTMDEVVAACKKVQVDKFINGLPMRYNTVIEEGGENFSGGQKQRLALARGVLKDADIYIFDEVTNQLDSITEELVWNVIHDITKEKTSLVITHHIAKIKDFDRILLMVEGQGVVAQGTHEELMEASETYRSMWIEQGGEDSE